MVKQKKYYIKRIESHSQMTLKNMRKHHMRMKKSTLKLLNIILKQILLWTWTKGHLRMDVCSHLYVGDVEITFGIVATRQNSIKHENEYLVEVE